MTPETEALIARVRELDKRATEDGLTQPMGDELADAAPQLATALEAAEKRADAEKWRADQADAYIKKLDGIIEEIGGVTFSCINPYEDLKSTIVGLKARADAAEAKLKVAQIALERIDKRSARPTTGTSELWAIAANALEALTQLSPENQS